jgi:hypothetical protein
VTRRTASRLWVNTVPPLTRLDSDERSPPFHTRSAAASPVRVMLVPERNTYCPPP